jgi:dimethylamine/trimethylamine dehydrogenase
MFFTGEGFRVNRQIRAAGATVVPNHTVTELSAGGARGENVWAPDPVEWSADAVVLVTQREPVDSLYREVSADPGRLEEEGIESVHRIGDCVAPRLIAESIFDGHRLAREIDSADPDTPLPFLRELPEFQSAG